MKLRTALEPFKGGPQVYCVGFAFKENSDQNEVLLILKSKPAWQAGKLNGIGGKLEIGELPHFAMAREFKEECGLETDPLDWDLFATITGKDYAVNFFRIELDPTYYGCALSTTEEEIISWNLDYITWEDCVPNLKTLIEIAKRPDWGFVHINVEGNNEANLKLSADESHS